MTLPGSPHALAAARQRMIATHIRARGVRNDHVLEAMAEVPREAFVPAGMEEFAYEDSSLPIGEGQTISQPYIVALMLDAAELRPGDRVLEIGAGSGYAAAVMSRIAGHVHTVERHASLADEAQHRFDTLGYGNIDVHVGDGSRGWPEAAPFDAIVVAAGAPLPPPALREQLSVGGCLLVPVGAEGQVQRLCKIRRLRRDRYEEQDLGAVRFVPLVGEQGWPDPVQPPRAEPAELDDDARVRLIARAAERLPDPDDPAFAAAFDRFADCRVVLLGESSHGTADFYRARAAITRRLVERHGFRVLAVEADWPDAAAINRHVRGRASAGQGRIFQRFPAWMWRNTEVAALVQWLKGFNDGRDGGDHAGFYGLDMYSMGESIAAVLAYMDRVDPQAAAVARERYGCLTPWQNSPSTYGRAALHAGHASCEQAVLQQCRELLEQRLSVASEAEEARLDAAQNARLVAAAERYYRAMYLGGAESWNLRDTHMFETLQHLLKAFGPQARAVVWAHNSHLGDARHTEMGASRGEINLGQLCREHYGEAAALIGFGTHTGEVAAAHDWDGEMERMRVRPSLPGSVEALCHDTGVGRFLLDLRAGGDPALREALSTSLLQRFIGVVYRPDTERYSHYAQASLARQFDAWVWFDRSTALTPLEGAGAGGTAAGAPDTFPFGV